MVVFLHGGGGDAPRCQEVRMVRIRIKRILRPTWTTQMPHVRLVRLAPNIANPLK